MTHERLYNMCLSAGFSKREAKALSFPKVNQYSKELQNADVIWKSGLIQKAIRSRRNFVNNCKSAGFTENQVKTAIKAFYRGQMDQLDSSPMKFLRQEYMLPSNNLSNYALSVKLRERAQINRVARVMGVHYGKKAPALPKPKPELFVKQPQDNFLGKI
jgi:hypothetical protein